MPQSEHPDFATLTDVIAPWAMRVAATLGLADHIGAGVTTIPELAIVAGADPDALRRLMRFLVVRGVFREIDTGSYALGPSAQLLKADHPAGRHKWLDLSGAGAVLDATYVGLLDSIRTGEPAYERVHGLSFWEHLSAEPALAASFDTLMAENASWFGEVSAAYDWTGIEQIVDVGGGTGALLADVLAAQPHLSGVLLDLPDTVAAAEAILDAAGVRERARVIGASFFDPWPPGAQVYLLSHVLHDWNDEDARRILRRGAEAIGEGGRLLLIERLADDEPDELLATKMDLRMLVLVGGRERGAGDFACLAGDVGLDCRTLVRTDSGRTLLECRKR
ncbi:methyltransferase [Nocardia sp. NPDC056100]|uniref:methyltransferase n=1 Tax=Nocardia sp. NPDC056100 TaxID=3345712 RepID=UPI0035D99065